MLEELRADTDANHALGVLRVKLTALIDDLKSIGAGEEDLQLLTALLDALESGADQPGDAVINAVQILERFAGFDQ